MPKVKISEFSSTPANNTDIDSINISEGCAPSGINDAIRELMAQLKDFQTGAVGDSFNGPVGTTTAAAGAFTTLTTTSTINNLTVGRGAGAVSTNTAVGAGALAATNTGSGRNTGVGNAALTVNTSGENNSGFGQQALTSNTTGGNNTASGYASLFLNTTGGSNTAMGVGSLQNNTTASNNTAVGYQAGYAITTGERNISVGAYAMSSATTGIRNTVIGTYAYNNSAVATSYVTSVGHAAGNVATGDYNTFIGESSGGSMSSGAKNTIVGRYNGNQGGLDIRTASNYIVLSDGDGNPRFSYISADSNWRIPYLGKTGTGRGSNNILSLNAGATAYDGSIQITDAQAHNVWWGLLNGAAYVMTNTNGVQLTSGATAWASVSDSRLKNVTGTYTNALTDIAQIEAVKFTWKSDEQASPQVGVIAQSVQNVVPEAISTTIENGQEYLSVRYTELIPLMIASIQQLKAEFDAYKASHP